MKFPARLIFNERTLQCVIAILALVPIIAGLAGMWKGQEMIVGSPYNLNLDSHFRYLSGILFAIGISFWCLIPRIAVETTAFRLLTFLVFVGGVSRLIGILVEGWPSEGMIFGLVMELAVTPAVCLWQSRIALQMRQAL